MTNIGRIILVPKGDYDNTATYQALDWVRYNNAAWVCKVNNTTTAPSGSSPNWSLLASDSNVRVMGDMADVELASEADGQYLGCVIDTSTTPPTITWENVSAATTYNTSSTVPISGVGVADALDNYYTKNEIGLDKLFKYGGAKTGAELITNTLLVAANAGKFYRATEDFISTSDYVQGAGHMFEAGSHIAVIEVSAGTYKFDNIAFAGVDEWHVYNGGVEEVVENSATGTRTVTFHGITSTDAVIPFADTADGRIVKFTSSTFDSNAETYTFTVNITTLPTKFRLRMIR